MKKNIYISTILIVLSSMIAGCSDYLDLDPKNKIKEEIVVSSEASIDAYLANLYGRLPVEDFNYSPFKGFENSDGWNSGMFSAVFCDESIHSEFDGLGSEWFDVWEPAYKLIRDVNIFIEKNNQFQVSEKKQKQYLAEGHMLRALTYFALAKRYGGVPVIKKAQEYTTDVASLVVPRSTEKLTWDFILEDCDIAISLFPNEDNVDSRRLNKWSSLGYKSRIALHVASIAKFSKENGLVLSGPAVEADLVGVPAEEADDYFRQCIDAAKQVMQSGRYGLYMPTPTSTDAAATNYQALFETPDNCLDGAKEPMFCKGSVIGSYTNNFDIFCRPNQLANGWPYPGRINPALDIVDDYDDYTDDGISNIGRPLQTTLGGSGDGDYFGFDVTKNYNTFNHPSEIFENKDARLRATIILPGSTYKGKEIVIQGGIIKQDGSVIFRTDAGKDGIVGNDGKKYFTYGSDDKTQYSGFDPAGGGYTRSGFLIRKFLQEKKDIASATFKGDNTWIDLRYAEILLNYAEAVVECTTRTSAELTLAQDAVNAIRRRAAHTDNLTFSSNIQSNRSFVRNERRIELAFENKRLWDLYRWRNFHLTYTNRGKKSLVQFVDLRHNPAKYIFVRMYMPELTGHTFYYNNYYRQIPGINNTGIIQNP